MKQRTWDTERAKSLFAEGYKNEEVAEMVGVSVPTIKNWKREAGLVVPRSARLKGDKVERSERYTTEEVKAVAQEARSKGLTYGELVAGKENRVEVKAPMGVTPCRAQELEREVFTEAEQKEVDLCFTLNGEEEINLRAASNERAVILLETMAQLLSMKGGRSK